MGFLIAILIFYGFYHSPAEIAREIQIKDECVRFWKEAKFVPAHHETTYADVRDLFKGQKVSITGTTSFMFAATTTFYGDHYEANGKDLTLRCSKYKPIF